MSLLGKKKQRSAGGMGRISDSKKYAQVLLEKDVYADMEQRATDCDFPSFSSWAAAVLKRELKEPKHIEP